MSRTDYLKEVHRQLYYKPLLSDPTIKFSCQISRTIRNIFTKDSKTKDFLIPKKSTAACFYILPKIHKPGIPGRPIVASNNSPTENISKFVDFHLKPLVHHIPSFVQDTSDFLRKIFKFTNLPANTILASLDVTTLYTNIPHAEGIEACRSSLDNRQLCSPPTDDITSLIELILTKNSFQFDHSHYLQIQGTAMGTRMAPSYANLFMHQWEQSFLATQKHQPLIWLRYIDDIHHDMDRY